MAGRIVPLTVPILLALAGVVAGGGGPAGATSFDCAKARAPDEIAVCANPNLSELDTELGALWFTYSRLPLLMGASGNRRDEARAFLATRAACGGDAGCLTRAYAARISALKQGITSNLSDLAKAADNPAPPAPPPVPQPVMDLIGSYNAACNRLGGQLSDNSWPNMMSADLDHDGIPDFVLNTQNLRCLGAATAFCANDGCAIDIALSSARFAHPVGARGATPTLVQDTDATRLSLTVDRSLCNAPAGASCEARYSWQNGALTPAYTARPAP
ncbi:lysozyme inhibitor LprI family protein [Ancylobacter lacus]|uniref:lysozyme inhibitor LprI family protein n=1 Tax=Ancylobacter lacus TaxID=2579970 RepID=UPI001BCE8BDC|nr:hypothetical protein [Ancylobacter lacus]MBS7540268.1 hypothetical protein [Ancylobacter lacus]